MGKTGEKDEDVKNPEVKKPEVARTLYFAEGFWCKELNQGFTIGYYVPKDEKEFAILQKFASKEKNFLKPSM
jgi:hypothetical protein